MEILMKLENKRTGKTITLANYSQRFGWYIASLSIDDTMTSEIDPAYLDDWQLRFDKVGDND